VKKGAKTLVDPALFRLPNANYVAPQVLVNVNHDMIIMTEETFGPVVGIMKVEDDEDAIRYMNDSQYGLTASIWTRSQEAAIRIGDLQVEHAFTDNAVPYSLL
jgi:acyl-CoA reductase-like NAD-dependent aldehyde dehydrogenase